MTGGRAALAHCSSIHADTPPAVRGRQSADEGAARTVRRRCKFRLKKLAQLVSKKQKLC
jgi:hypothetical protein